MGPTTYSPIDLASRMYPSKTREKPFPSYPGKQPGKPSQISGQPSLRKAKLYLYTHRSSWPFMLLASAFMV